MSSSIYLRLAGPLQSWAGAAVTGNIAHTESEPTRSGLTGLLAGACGFLRGELPGWLDDTHFTIRTDNRGIITDEFQTINPRTEETRFRRRLLLSQGINARSAKSLIYTPDAEGGTSIVNRTYIGGGEFIVQVTNIDHTEELISALQSPVFSPYLGRKAFAPAFPFVLGMGDASAIYEIPSLRKPKRHSGDAATLSFTTHSPELPAQRHLSQVPVVHSRQSWLDAVREKLTPLS
ncbi:type I-E CRISPR-associated protein Cas5/CasD [Trueperella pyogenes]|uniref:type I-E CRISPR-associated protein Cas5/CasD n=1 Tax=Trueperella pyogenes TaxID=1661 RepID=UPI0024C06A1D|nr:type I-E CRISPR-associated protein Cas5/CasD [Trueperella pyogenes]WHU60426.1 type I-E CRISPR-associated protein Cas5/CasD [Trueperella pyogenes]